MSCSLFLARANNGTRRKLIKFAIFSNKEIKNCIPKIERVIQDVEEEFKSRGLEITLEKTK